MPNRDLKECNRRSASLQVISDAAERLWYRLITAVDDFGRMEADPEVVFKTCFERAPKSWNEGKVQRCLHELAEQSAPGQSPMIFLYQVGPKWYLQITSSDIHLYRRAKVSKYPACDQKTTHYLTPQEIRDEHGCAQMRADSLVSRIPSPELRIPNPESRTSVGAPPVIHAAGSVDGFTLTPELEAWCAKEGIQNPVQYLDEFRDYWLSVGGKRKNGQAVKDWAATFRNRLRTLKNAGQLKDAKLDWKAKFLAGEE